MWQQLIDNLTAVNPALVAGVLGFAAVFFLGLGFLVFRQQRAVAQRPNQAEFQDRIISPEERKKSRLTRFFEAVGNYVSHGRSSTNLWEQLIRAGYMGAGAPAVYTGIKILLFFLGLTVTLLLSMPLDLDPMQKLALIMAGAIVPFILPNIYVRMQEKKRCQEVQQALPDVVDLLEICVSSGVGLDMAWNMVAEDVHQVSPVLGTAMDLTNFEMHMGASRADAMRNMGRRTGAEQLASMAAILVQSERFGTSIAVALREFAASMREERSMRAEENAEKMAVKLIVPVTLFIFPAVAIVVAGPAVINIFNSFFMQQ
jgi:tight adherence protein C